MKFYTKNILLVFSLFCFRRVSLCQPRSKQFIFQIYEDNDFMNIYGRGSDHWYTNGTRLNIFYNRSKKPRSLFYQLSPKAGPGSISTYGWAIMQAMITPSSLNKTFLQRNDYPYAGASFVLHSLHFSDPYRRMNLQTDWVIGVMGPPSLAGQAQTLVHNIGGFASPQGWKYQLPTDLLLNYNLGIEKALTGTRTVGFIAKANLFAGSMMDGISLSSQLRMGRFEYWFNGVMDQLLPGTKKVMFSAALTPGIDLFFYDALLEGGMFNANSPFRNTGKDYSLLKRKMFKAHFDLEAQVAFHGLGISFTQKTLSRDFEGLGGQNIGNISVYLRL